jgi:type IV pilus assembly protein PilN
MIRINLLPHRDEKRRARQKQFGILAALSAVLALAVAAGIWYLLNSQIDNQKERNKYLVEETAKLQKKIDEISRIREETAALLAKKQVVEGLQSNRSEPVQLLDQLLRQLPEGLYLKSVKQVGTKVTITGYAQSNARVAALMRNIESSPYITAPNLAEIKAVTVNNVRANEFSLDLIVKRTQENDGKAAAGKPSSGAVPEKKV